MLKWTLLWTLMIFLPAVSIPVVYAKERPASFSSAYTYLSKDCKWAYSESELEEGQDNALICKGYGKYRIYIYYSAMDSFLLIQSKKNPDDVIFSPAVRGINEKEGVVEWRMANGVPFAVIVRSREYSDPEDGRKLLKESLIVRGLGQYSGIDGIVDTRGNKSAGEEAGNIADTGYRKKQRPAGR